MRGDTKLILLAFLIALSVISSPVLAATTYRNDTSIYNYENFNYIDSDFWWFIIFVALFFFIISNLTDRNNDIFAAISVPFSLLGAYWSTAIDINIIHTIAYLDGTTPIVEIVRTHTIQSPIYLSILLFGFFIICVANLIKIIGENRVPDRATDNYKELDSMEKREPEERD